jgi:uncharacterized repeat protein (TIGR01451 family)
MKKILYLLLFTVIAATSYGQATFVVTTVPCNHNGVIASTFTGLTPPLTVTYTTSGTSGTTIVHTGVTTLTDVLTSYSGGPFSVMASDGLTWDYGYYGGMSPFTYTINPTPAVCPALGSENAIVTGGTPPYTYSWYDETTMTTVGTSNPIGLPPGTYGVEVTDAAGCVYGSQDQSDSSLLGSIPSYSVGVTTTPANCSNGTATSGTPGGGAVPPYSYLWSNGATTTGITGLTSGYYLFTMTDALGCAASAYGYVPQAVTISVPVTPTPATCIATDGAVIGFGSGGLTPYTYLWSNGATTQSQTGLASGYYDVTATDANGCIGYGSTYVGASTPITVTYSTTPTLCTSPTGTATIAPVGGTLPYAILWYTTPPQTTVTATSLPQGNYGFHVTDALGCVQSGTVIVPPIDVISGIFMSTPAVCTLSNGSMAVAPSGGALPYTYLWSTGATTSGISSVPASLYHVTITDANSCYTTLSEWLPWSSTLGLGTSATPSSCIFVNDGTASATGISGTPPYTYAWSTGGSSSTIGSLYTGPYWVTVTDALGCWRSSYDYVPSDTASFCYCTIEGTVYYDANGNCIQDPGEPGIPNVQMYISGRGYVYTDLTGHYAYKVPTGSYTVSETILAYYPLAGCQVNNIPVSVVGGTGCTTNVDFANSMLTIHDMHISTWDYNRPVPGHTYTQIMVMNNNGTVTEPAILAGYHPDGQLFAPTFIPGGTFAGAPYWYNTFAVSDAFVPGASQSFLINYTTPTSIPLGTNVLFEDTVANAAPISNWLTDYSPWNNVNYLNTVVVASFDPNFKEVSPAGTGPTGIISYTDSILQYMVHFQNTGTGTAENVVVKDTLDNNLNWTTLVPVFNSNQGQVTLAQSGPYKIATFTFNHINLPASSSEPVTSNGMFMYSIHTKPGLPVGSTFKNSASIYFDYNAPVKTNQTINTLGKAAPTKIDNVTTANSNLSFSVYPNPAANSCNAIINSDVAGSADMKIADLSGKTLISKTIQVQQGAQTVSLDITPLAPGIYFVNFTQNGKTQTQKLVVIKS